jgi:hypothetical protein
MKDHLFLLKPGFFIAERGPFYCGDSLPIEGLISLYPALRDAVEVVHIDFARPRANLVEILGEEHQSAPVLVLANPDNAPADVETKTASGKHFIDNEADIRRYLSKRFALAQAS